MKKLFAILIFTIIAIISVSCAHEPEKESFYVTFSGNDVTPYTVTIEQNQTVPMPSEPTTEGKQFLYWATESGEQFDFGAPVTKDVVLYAVWAESEDHYSTTYYTVNFYDVNGEFICEQQVAEGESATSPAVFVSDFFVFSGWSENISCITEDIDVYAMQRYDSVDASLFDYEQNFDGTYTITDVKEGAQLPQIAGGYSKLALPTEYNGKPITAIAAGEKYNGVFSRYNILSLYIPSCYKSIGAYAFYANPALSQVTFNEGLVSIGEGAFMATFGEGYVFYGRYANSGASAYISALTEIRLPSSLESIGAYAFNHVGGEFYKGTYVLNEVTLTFAQDSSLKSIGAYAFEGVQIPEINLPNSSSLTIGDYAFAADVYTNWVYVNSYNYPRSITTKISIPNCVTSIGERAFYGAGVTSWYYGNYCYSSQKDVLFDVDELELDSLGKEAFSGAKLKGSLNLSVNQIPNYAFFGQQFSNITLNGVSLIGEYAFGRESGSQSLTLTLSDNITIINDYAFVNNDGLTSLKLPSMLIKVGSSAFKNCSSLSGDLTFSTTVKMVGQNAFESTKLTSISVLGNTSFGAQCFANSAIASVRGGVSLDEDYVFSGCESLVSVELLANVSSLPEGTFYGCKSLQQVALPESITCIGKKAFAYCEKIESIELFENLTTICDKAFYSCSLLNNVIFDGQRLTHLGNEAFALCPKLVDIKLPDSVATIGDCAFMGTGITSFKTPASLTKLGVSVFMQHEYVSSKGNGITPFSIDTVIRVKLPVVSEIVISRETGIIEFCDSGTFDGSKISGFVVESGNKHYSAVDGILCSLDQTKIIAYIRDESVTEVNLPSGVVEISSGAFRDISNIISVTLPSSLQTIGSYAFYNCTNLKSITIPSSVTCIGEYAFAGSEKQFSSLSSIIFTDFAALTCIEEGAFAYNDALESFKAPSSIVTIGKKAFFNASKLNNLDLSNASSLSSIGFLAFGGDNNCGTAIESLDFSGCSSLSATGKYAFAASNSLKNINFGNLTTIDEGSFYACTALKRIEIASNITQICASAFRKCVGVEQILVCQNSKLQSIGAYAFAGSHYEDVNYSVLDLTNATMLNLIDDYAFAYGKVQSVKLPDSEYEIGEEAFSSCSLLVEIDFGEGITSIGQNAFKYCTALTEINIPSSVKTIAKEAFSELNLITVNIGSERDGNNLQSIGKRAFFGCNALEVVNIYGDNVPMLLGNTDNLSFHCFDDDWNVKILQKVKIYVDSEFISEHVKNDDFETGWLVYEGCLVEREA
ncbi:MAG: leucine-rich repeat protein [Clostridia bacterium]|nr:leucine-rich repeat protein [Clostridia bacterium]